MIPFILSGTKISGKLIATQNDFNNLTVEAGDIINLLSGQSFYGQLTIDQPNVTVKAYGGGAIPKLKGSFDISSLSYTEISTGIWRAALAVEPKWVFHNGECMKISQSPELTITGRSAANKLTVSTASIATYTDIIGSYLAIKLKRFRVGKLHTITDYNVSTGEITLDGDTIFYGVSGYGTAGTTFWLFNDVEYFSGNNEWTWREGFIYIKSTVDPSDLTIEATNLSYGIKTTAQNTTVQNIEILHHHDYGIYEETDGNGLNVNNCKIHDLRGIGILSNSQKTSVYYGNNEIYNCKGGIADAVTINPVIEDNHVHDWGMQLNPSFHLLPLTENYAFIEDVGIYLHEQQFGTQPNGAIIRRNSIINGAYNCLKLKGINGKIYHNVFENGIQVLEDGGWIYATGTRSQSKWFEDNEVYNNIFKGSSPHIWTRALYLDNYARNNNYHHNVFDIDTPANVIYSDDDNHLNTFDDNIIIINGTDTGNNNNSFEFQDQPGYTVSRNENNNLRRNIIVSRNQSSHLINLDNTLGTAMDNVFAISDYNYYINPFATKILASDDYGSLNLAGIQSTFGTDANSISKTNWLTWVNRATALEQVKVYLNETASPVNQLIPSGYEDIDGNDISGQTLEIPAYYGLVALKTTD